MPGVFLRYDAVIHINTIARRAAFPVSPACLLSAIRTNSLRSDSVLGGRSSAVETTEASPGLPVVLSVELADIQSLCTQYARGVPVYIRG